MVITRFGPPSPLNHLWSLAVEEQFYLAWPWLLLGVWMLRNRRGGGARRLALPTLALGAGSALAMTAFYHPGSTRRYEARRGGRGSQRGTERWYSR